MPFFSFRSLSGVRGRLLLLLLVVVPFSLHAQPVSTGSRTQDETSIFRAERSPATSSSTGQLPPIERPIDAETYRLGPNDQLVLSLPLIEPGEFPLVVGLDNTLLLPRGFALLDVRGMTLASLRRTVDSLYRARSSSYRNVTVALVKPRSIYVTVSGDVVSPGRMVLTAADRVTTAIDLASRISEELPIEQRALLLKERGRLAEGAQRERGGLASGLMERRWVTLRHNNGRSQRIDLLRYRALGAEADNPTLREGDEVIVHPADLSVPRVGVSGAVNSPAVMPYSPGDNALMLVRLANGARDENAPAEAYINRVSGGSVTQIQLDLSDSAALAAVPLQPGDQLVVASSPNAVAGAAGLGVVSVVGEVERPSTYPIVPGTTTLSDVIQLAGGFRSDASLNGAFIRRTRSQQQYRRDLRDTDPGAVMSTSTLTLDDTTRLKYDLENQHDRVSADFVEIFERGNRGRDVALESGDEIVIPTSPRQVFVRGRVNKPGWVPFLPGGSYEAYIDMAGGFTEAAVESRVQVLKYATSIWQDPDETEIRAGDEIYVPGERDVPPRTALENANTIIAITSSVVSLASTIYFFVQNFDK